MRIDLGKGTPIHVVTRPGGGIAIEQSRSHIILSSAEIPVLISAIEKMAGVGGSE